jgi:hypothetical protein
MGYRVLGYVVWRGGKWYIRRRLTGGLRRRLALGGLAAGVAAGAAIAQRVSSSDNALS